jgi:hypothetical protein
MTEREFQDLHARCERNLRRYMEEAQKTCSLLRSCRIDTLTFQERNAILHQRLAENQAFEDYNEIRARLLDVVKLGFGDPVA